MNKRLPIARPREMTTEALPWCGALLVILLIFVPSRHVVSASSAITGLLALGVVLLAAKRPDRSLVLLVLLLPFTSFVLAELYTLGVPASVVRHASAWKEALAIGIVLSGVRTFLATGRRADSLDRLALAFVFLLAVYLVAQKLIVPGAPTSLGTRVLAFRQDAGFVLVLLGARHAPLPVGFAERLATVALFSAVLVAGVCVFEAIDSGGWNHFVVDTIRYPVYEAQILNSPAVNPYDIRVYGTIGGTTIIRPGSVFLSPLTSGFYLVLGFALALERGLRRRATKRAMLVLALVGAAILLTETRSAILAAVLVGVVAFQPAAGRARHWRTQLGLLALALAIGIVPVLASTSVVNRIGGAGNQADNAGHVSAFWTGLGAIESSPLGHGLGTSAGVGQRSTSSEVVIPENGYLQVGIETGVIAMLLFGILTVALIFSLRRAARGSPSATASAVWAAAIGLAVATWFLQTWVDFSVAWTVWGMCGVALNGKIDAQATRAPINLEPASAPSHAVLTT